MGGQHLTRLVFDLQDVLQVAERVRIVGNFYYKSEQYIKANSKYKKALRYLMKFQEDAQTLNHDLSPKEEVDVTHAVIHNLLNSAACKIKLQLYDQALENCNEALDSVPNHVKALYRRGQAYHGKREYERAVVSTSDHMFRMWSCHFVMIYRSGPSSKQLGFVTK